MLPIYLDYNATTPVDPVVQESISQALRDLWGNPSSLHVFGRSAHAAMDKARAQVASLIGALPEEIVFTGGGSEASNLALIGSCLRPAESLRLRNMLDWLRSRSIRPSQCHLIVSSVEHPATQKPVEFLQRLGAKVTVLSVDGTGMIDPDDVRQALRSSRKPLKMVSIMHSNNEVGNLMPIREIGELKKEHHFLFHTDCAQSLGKIAVDVNELQVDLLTVAGHKLYAPKGIGALYVRRGVTVTPLIHGAGHESGRRAGTENVPYMVGLGTAAELAKQSLPGASEQLRMLRDRLHAGLETQLGGRISLNGHPTLRLPNTLNVNLHGWVGAEFLARTPRIAASTGSACHEGTVSQSPVLCAMKVPPELGQGAIRFSVGRLTTVGEIDQAIEIVAETVRAGSAMAGIKG